MAKRGAKLKLNKNLEKQICNDIKAGVPITHAAVMNGIDASTFYAWYNKGKTAKSGKFRDFYLNVEEAKSVAIGLRVKRIYKAGEVDWKSDAWWLERMVPESFARKDKMEVKSDNTNTNVNMEVKSTDKVLEENADTLTRFIERRIKPED